MSSAATEHKANAINKSCEGCRRLKIRCLPIPESSPRQCQRCAKLEQECRVVAPRKRQPRSRGTQVRVADLEDQIRTIRALFAGPKSRSIVDSAAHSCEPPNDPPESVNAQRHSTSARWLSSQQSGQDVVQRGLLTMDVANSLYRDYVTILAPRYPLVVLPTSYSAAQCREEKPLLFLAIIAAAAGRSNPYLYSTLNAEVMQEHTCRIVLGNEKSVEMVQAMIVTVVWYHPPDKFSQAKFFELIHMAATVAMDIGLADSPSDDKIVLSTRTAMEDIERWRTLLSCYLNCCGSSLSMRRPNMFRFNAWISKCAASLASSPHAAPSDGRLIAWVGLLNIAEEIVTAFSMDTGSECARVLPSQKRPLLKGFEKALMQWADSVEISVWNAELSVTHHYVRILLYEIELYVEHPRACFRPPFCMQKPRTSNFNGTDHLESVESLSQCLDSIHSLFDVFLEQDIGAIRSMPSHILARVRYASIVLTRLQVSCESSTSSIGKHLNKNDLRLDDYAVRVIDTLACAAEPDFQVPRAFLGPHVRLRQWYLFQRAAPDNHSGKSDDEDFTIFDSKPDHPVLRVSIHDAVSDATASELSVWSPGYQTKTGDRGSEHELPSPLLDMSAYHLDTANTLDAVLDMDWAALGHLESMESFDAGLIPWGLPAQHR